MRSYDINNQREAKSFLDEVCGRYHTTEIGGEFQCNIDRGTLAVNPQEGILYLGRKGSESLHENVDKVELVDTGEFKVYSNTPTKLFYD